MTNDPDAIIRKHVIVNFIKRHKTQMRAKRRNLKLAKQNFRQKLVKLHLTTRKRLVRTNISETYDQKRGNFLSNQRFNVDQSPMLFAIDMKRTYHLYEPAQDQNKKKVWISHPGCGLEKGQCTLQTCFRPDRQQPRIGMFLYINPLLPNYFKKRNRHIHKIIHRYRLLL